MKKNKTHLKKVLCVLIHSFFCKFSHQLQIVQKSNFLEHINLKYAHAEKYEKNNCGIQNEEDKWPECNVSLVNPKERERKPFAKIDEDPATELRKKS